MLLQIPRGFNPRRPALMVVFFHGNEATLTRDVRRRQQVPQQIAESGLNAVLVAPQFAVDARDSSAGRFWEPGVFAQFIEEAANRLTKLYGDERARDAFQSAPVVLVAYSGGYQPAAFTLAHGGANERLEGVILFDALYGELDKFADWIARRSAGVCRQRLRQGRARTKRHAAADVGRARREISKQARSQPCARRRCVHGRRRRHAAR